MKFFRILFLLITIFAASAITLSKAQEEKATKGGSGVKQKASSSKEITGCAANPKVCHGDKSPGPDCCDNKCVDVKTNNLHCNKCGKMCNTAKICCKGKCVNPLTNQKNCGQCGKECLAGTCLNGKCTEG